MQFNIIILIKKGIVMLTYKGKYVKAQKVPIKESMPDLLHIQKDSYKKYIKEIVFKDFKYFEDVLNKSLKFKIIFSKTGKKSL